MSEHGNYAHWRTHWPTRHFGYIRFEYTRIVRQIGPPNGALMGDAGFCEQRQAPLHLILQVQFLFLEIRFEENVFGTKVGIAGELLKLRIVLGVLSR